jgi:integrase
VKKHLRPDLQVAVSIAYAFGWRMQSEVLKQRLDQVDLNACTIRLEPGTTKNDEGRIVYLTPELHSLIQAQVDRGASMIMGCPVLPATSPRPPGPDAGLWKVWDVAARRRC